MNNGWKFEVGKDAVCRVPDGGKWVVTAGQSLPPGEPLPVGGQTYRVTAIETDDEFPDVIFLGLAGWQRQTFDAGYFEPVHTTDISALVALLAPAPKRALEDA